MQNRLKDLIRIFTVNKVNDSVTVNKAITFAKSVNLPDISVEVGDLALEDGKMIIGNSSGKAVANAVTGDVTISNAGVTAIGAKKVADVQMAIANGKIVIGDSGGAGAAQILTGDVTMNASGVTIIGAGKVTSSMLANGAGWAALLTAGLGASAAYPKTTNGVQILHTGTAGNKVVLFIVTVTETFANVDGVQPTFKFGEVGTDDKFAATTLFTDAVAGTMFVFSGVLTASTNLICTATELTGTTDTGAISVMAMILPQTA